MDGPCILNKDIFRFGKYSFKYTLPLDMAKYVQRKYFFENYGQDLGLTMIKQLKSKKSVFVDIGAHIGFFTMLAAHLAPEGKVISFEPMSENFEQLTRNVAINNLKNVSTFNAAISDRTGQHTLNIDPHNDGGHSMEDKWCYVSEPVSVDVITFDSWMIDNAVDRIDFIKIDVEGHEFAVIEGMLETIRSVKPKIIFCETNVSTGVRIKQLLENHGYEHRHCTDKLIGPTHPNYGQLSDMVFYYSGK